MLVSPSSAIQSVVSSGHALTPGTTGSVGSAVFSLHDNGSLDYHVSSHVIAIISTALVPPPPGPPTVLLPDPPPPLLGAGGGRVQPGGGCDHRDETTTAEQAQCVV